MSAAALPGPTSMCESGWHAPKRQDVLGVQVSVVNMRTALEVIDNWIERGERHYVCVTGVHGIMESRSSTDLMRIHNEAGMVTPDGMPVAWMLRLAGHADSDRVCGPELMPLVFEHGQARGFRHFLYGTTPETLTRLRERLLQCAPQAIIAGSYSPPFRALTSEEDEEIAEMVNASGADIVWVGLSTPKQERWMAKYRPRLAASVLIGVGAAFDITAGVTKRAPHFLRRTGLEWSYRLMKEPRRLWRRYLRHNSRFVMLMMLQGFGLRQGPFESGRGARNLARPG